jgi:hypothetical protein
VVPVLVAGGAVLLLLCPLLAPVAGIGVAVLAMGVVQAAAVAGFLWARHG